MKEDKAVKLFRGVTGIGDDLIEEAGTVRTGKKISPWRWGLIAACLCVALLGTASAVASAAGVQIRWLNGVRHPDKTLSGYVVTDEGITLFPQDCFSEDVIALAAAEKGSFHINGKSFASWEELEQFVGMNLIDNPILDGASPGWKVMYQGMEDKATHILLTAHGAAEEDRQAVSSIFADGSYKLDDIIIHVQASIHTDQFDRTEPTVEDGYEEAYEAYKGAVLVQSIVKEGDELTEEEIYTARCGVPVTIMRYTSSAYGTKYLGYFILDGILVSIRAETNPVGYTPETLPDDPVHTLEVLKTVLDGFEL